MLACALAALALSLSLVTGCSPSGAASSASSPGRPHLSCGEKIRGTVALIEMMASTRKLEQRQAQALAHGRATIAPAREMRALYPGVDESFSYYTGEVAGTVWNSVVGLHERYVLTLQVPVTLDAERTHVVAQGAPAFFLSEVDRVERLPPSDPGAHVFYARSVHFGAAEWASVVSAGGDLSSVLGGPMRKGAPVPGFAAALPAR